MSAAIPVPAIQLLQLLTVAVGAPGVTGLSIRHIELLTGQPAQTILRLLKARGIAHRIK